MPCLPSWLVVNRFLKRHAPHDWYFWWDSSSWNTTGIKEDLTTDPKKEWRDVRIWARERSMKSHPLRISHPPATGYVSNLAPLKNKSEVASFSTKNHDSMIFLGSPQISCIFFGGVGNVHHVWMCFFSPLDGFHFDARRMVIGLLARGRVHGPLHRHRPVIGRCLSRVGGSRGQLEAV